MYNIAGINIQLITNNSASILNDSFSKFKSNKGIPYTIIRHELSNNVNYGKEEFKTVYKNDNWLIKMNHNLHIYEYKSEPWVTPSYKVSTTFKEDYSFGTSIFQNITKENYNKLKLNSLTGLGTDQALFSNLLSTRQGFLLHGNGVSVDGKTYIFSGGSGKGKTTISNMLLKNKGSIFSEDRSIIRKIGDCFYTYGSCIHPGRITKADYKEKIDKMFFIEHDKNNSVELIKDKRIKYNLVLKSVIKSFINKSKLSELLNLMEDFTTIPFYRVKFNLDGEINNIIKELK